MADMREHNNSPMPGLARNNDPALDIAHEHQHQHKHHSARAIHPDKAVYTTGTTNEKSNIPDQESHVHHRQVEHDIEKNGIPGQDTHAHKRQIEHDVEKTGGYDYEVEKGTHSSSDRDGEIEKRPWYRSISAFYRMFRLPIHLFMGALFTA